MSDVDFEFVEDETTIPLPSKESNVDQVLRLAREAKELALQAVSPETTVTTDETNDSGYEQTNKEDQNKIVELHHISEDVIASMDDNEQKDSNHDFDGPQLEYCQDQTYEDTVTKPQHDSQQEQESPDDTEGLDNQDPAEQPNEPQQKRNFSELLDNLMVTDFWHMSSEFVVTFSVFSLISYVVTRFSDVA